MPQTKTGTIRKVASTGGLIFEDEPNVWYNPIKSLAPQLATDAARWQGKRVIATLGDHGKNTVVKLELDTSVLAAPPSSSKDAPKDYRISRHGALNTAIEITRLMHECGETLPTRSQDVEQRLTSWADWVLRYVEVPRP